MSGWHSKTHFLFNEKEIASSGTELGHWVNVSGAEGFNFWAFLEEDTASPSLTISVDVSLFDPGMVDGTGATTHDRASTDRDNFRTIEVKSAETSQDAWQHYDTPDEMQYPICWIRGRVVEGGVGECDTFSLAMTVNVSRP